MIVHMHMVMTSSCCMQEESPSLTMTTSRGIESPAGYPDSDEPMSGAPRMTTHVGASTLTLCWNPTNGH